MARESWSRWGSKGLRATLLEPNGPKSEALEAKFRRQQELAAQRARLDKDAQLRDAHGLRSSGDE